MKAKNFYTLKKYEYEMFKASLGLTNKVIASKTGFSESAVAKYAQGLKCTHDFVHNFSKAYKKDPNDFFVSIK